MNAAEELADLAEAYWKHRLEESPTFATSIGDRRFDDRLSDISPEGRARRDRFLETLLTRARAIPKEALEPHDRVTWAMLFTDASARLDALRSGIDEWSVDPLHGPQVSLLNIESFQPIRTIDEARAMVSRWTAMGPYVSQYVANLRASLAGGKIAVEDCVSKVVEELKDLEAKGVEGWPLLKPLKASHEDWSETDRVEFRDGLTRAVAESVRPAFDEYRAMLQTELLPRARPASRPGILHVPDGARAYRRMIRVYTSLDLSPDEIHATGLAEVARVNRELSDLGAVEFGVVEREGILERLRSDRKLYFATPDEVAEKAEDALAKARAAIPKWFGRLPKAHCIVVRMGEHEEKHSTIAYYRQPAADGSRPGSYYINTSEPDTRPRYEAEALAYHEAIPGHHLQLAIMQELTNLPAFRRHSGVTAFVEGWGLYTERLADEMGLYSSDLDRIGMLSYDAWRACRLVVDTGMHAMGWTRQAAIDFMEANTALAMNNIVNEVDRYISWPGQALAYKTGQLEILRLRAVAREKLRSQFDIRSFHDAVLENGAVSLSVLQDSVNEYIEKVLRS